MLYYLSPTRNRPRAKVKAERNTDMRHIIRAILDCFFDTTVSEYWEWTWDSPAEREAFIKYFRFCH